MMWRGNYVTVSLRAEVRGHMCKWSGVLVGGRGGHRPFSCSHSVWFAQVIQASESCSRVPLHNNQDASFRVPVRYVLSTKPWLLQLYAALAFLRGAWENCYYIYTVQKFYFTTHLWLNLSKKLKSFFAFDKDLHVNNMSCMDIYTL